MGEGIIRGDGNMDNGTETRLVQKWHWKVETTQLVRARKREKWKLRFQNVCIWTSEAKDRCFKCKDWIKMNENYLYLWNRSPVDHQYIGRQEHGKKSLHEEEELVQMLPIIHQCLSSSHQSWIWLEICIGSNKLLVLEAIRSMKT